MFIMRNCAASLYARTEDWTIAIKVFQSIDGIQNAVSLLYSYYLIGCHSLGIGNSGTFKKR